MGLKWEPATPLRKPDNLVSFPLFRNIKQFTPSYEKDAHEYNMYYLLGWEYGRIWFNENRKWEKLMYGKENKSEIFRRGFIHRRPQNKKIKEKNTNHKKTGSTENVEVAE